MAKRSKNSRDPQSLHLAGLTAFQKGDAAQGLDLLARSVRMSPSDLRFRSNFGEILRRLGRLDEAEREFRHVLARDPHHPDALNNLGIVLLGTGRKDEAVATLERAARVSPQAFGPLKNLALALVAAGRPDEALDRATAALQLGEDEPLHRGFADAAARASALPRSSYPFFLRAFTEGWAAPRTLSRPVATLVRDAPTSDELLIALLKTTPVHNLELEARLGRQRAELILGDDLPLAFASALAQQCFLNEYLYPQSMEERSRTEALRASIANGAASNMPISPLSLCAAGCYGPLSEIAGIEELLNREWPQPVAELLMRQVAEPRLEAEFRETLPQLTPIDDDVSRLVRDQYEASPYPRWVEAGPPPEAGGFDEFFAAHHMSSQPINGNDLLIAGCGTGQHSIETARRFPAARILAIDLSRTSLAYAIRKTRALGLANIEYGQADILHIGSLGRSFDWIESAGVLHHMADPFAGWHALLSVLKPGGVMRIALYSEAARKPLESARRFIVARGYDSSPDAIRACRQALIEAADPATGSPDFFTLSECRDLLFHVQERRFDLPTIRRFLLENGLTFLGFELETSTRDIFTAAYPGRLADLDCWAQFEAEHPNTFGAMYRFLVRRS